MFFNWQWIIKCDTYSQWATIHLYENKIINFAEKCMELEKIMLRKVTETLKERSFMFFLI